MTPLRYLRDSSMNGYSHDNAAADHENIEKTPAWAGKILESACLTGLSPSEVIECVKLLISFQSFNQ